jgi:predicted aspartyl protease
VTAIRLVVLLLLLPPFALLSRSQAATPEAEVPFELIRNEIVVAVRINGQGPLRVLLDTGTSPSAIDRAAAIKLGLTLTAPGVGSGAGPETIDVHETSFERLELGGLKAERVAALAVDLSGLATQLKQPVVGVLGYSLLRDRIVQIDYPRGHVRFFDSSVATSDVPGKVVTLPFRLGKEDAPLLDGVTIKGRSLTALLDTGSSGMLLLPTIVARRMGLHREIGRAKSSHAAGYGGKFSLRQGKIDRVQIGSLVIADPEAAFDDSPDEPGREYDVNLGNRLMKQFVVTFDYRKKRVSFATAGGTAAGLSSDPARRP